MQKGCFLLLVIWLATLVGAPAQVVESFDYTDGTLLAGAGAAGDGWAGPWLKTPNSPDIQVVSGGIASTGVPWATGSNRLTVSHVAGNANKRYFRKLSGSWPDAPGAVYYLSFFIDNSWPAGTGDNRVSYVMLVDSATLGDGGPGGQLAQFGRIFNSPFLGVGRGGTVLASTAPADTGHWCVVALYMSGDAANEDIFFFVDPDPYSPLDTATADIKWSGIALNAGFDALGIKVEGTNPLDSWIDEIRLDTTYAGVVPTTWTAIVGPAREPFNTYAIGQELSGLGGNSGGWGDSWLAESGSSLMTVADSGLVNEALLKATSGDKARFDFTAPGSPNLRIARPLNAPFTDDVSTYYLSFHTQSVVTDVNNTVTFLMLVDTATYAGTGPGGQLVQIGKPLNTPFLGVGVGAPSNFSLTTASADEAHLVVLKIKTSGNADPDTIDMFVDPDLTAEPSTPDATRIFGTNLNNGFNAIGVKVEGISPGIVSFYEDIYVGLDYASVIPGDYSDVQSGVTAFAFDQFDFGPGTELAGSGTAEDGWAGPWEALTDPDSSRILAPGLLNETLLVRTDGPSALLVAPGTNNRIRRLLTAPIDTSAGGFWFSTHMAIGGSIAGNVGTLNFIDTTLSGPQFQQIVVGKRFGVAEIFAGGFGSGGDQVTGESFDLATGRWIVGHLVRNNGTWELDLWVDPDPGLEPQEADAQIQNKVYTTGNIHGVMLKAEGTAGVQFLVDDLYLGATFVDVVPTDLVPIPPAPDGAVETFNDYAGGDSLIGQQGGSGWAAPWTLVAGANQVVRDTSLTSFFILQQTSGQSVYFENLARVVRPLAGTYGDIGRSFWLSWMFDTDNGGPNVAHLVLADTATYGPSGPGGQLVQVGKLFGASELGMVAAAGGSVTGVSTDTTHWLVMEIVTDGSSANDSLFLWVDPDPATTPSRGGAALLGAADLTNWNALGFKVEGTAGVQATWDDIYLGRQFGEVVPPDWTAVNPPEIPVLALESFDYPAGGDLDGLDGGEGWGGPWAQVAGSASIASGSIASDRVDGIGNRALLDQSSTAVTYERPFFNRFGAFRTTVWMSFLLQVDNKSIGNGGGLALLRNGSPVLTLGGIPGLSNLGVTYNGGATSLTASSQSVVDTMWVVARMRLTGDNTADTTFIWINPPADALPAEANALFVLNDLDLDEGFDALRLTATGLGSFRMMADELAVGFSFRDISPKFGSDDPNLLAYEPFNYDAGTSLIGQGGVNAFWDGLWENKGNLSTNEAEILAGNLSQPGFEPVGNKTEFRYLNDGTQIRIDRRLAFPLESDGSTYWVTFFMNTTDGTAPNNVGNVTLRNSGIAGADGQRVGFGRIFNTNRFGMIAPPQNIPWTSQVPDDGLNWVVVKIQTVDDLTVPDTLWMWVNPPAGTEPDTAAAEVLTASTGAVQKYFTGTFLKDGIDVVRVKAEGVNGNETPYVTEFDEIRIARSWTSASTATRLEDPREWDPFGLQAFPNPFATVLTLRFTTSRPGPARVEVLDLQGRVLEVLADGSYPPGTQTLTWETGDRLQGLPNGYYLIRMRQGDLVSTRRLILYR